MLRYALEGVLVLALFVAAIIWDTVTAIDVAPSLVVQLRMFALLYAAVWAVRLAIGGGQAVLRALKPQPWRVLGWLAFAVGLGLIFVAWMNRPATEADLQYPAITPTTMTRPTQAAPTKGRRLLTEDWDPVDELILRAQKQPPLTQQEWEAVERCQEYWRTSRFESGVIYYEHMRCWAERGKGFESPRP